MTRAAYKALRAKRYALQCKLRDLITYQRMADSQTVADMVADAEDRARIRQKINDITMQLPHCGADPLCFRIMSENWKRRRSHVEYRCRQRRKDAERLVRHNARYHAPFSPLATTPDHLIKGAFA